MGRVRGWDRSWWKLCDPLALCWTALILQTHLPNCKTFLIEQSETSQMITSLSDDIVVNICPFAESSQSNFEFVSPSKLHIMFSFSHKPHSLSNEKKSRTKNRFSLSKSLTR